MKYKVTHDETFTIESEIEADSPDEALEVASFLSEKTVVKAYKKIPEIKDVWYSHGTKIDVEEILPIGSKI